MNSRYLLKFLREAIANALIHRDYDSRFEGEAISIDIYEDRVEVVNPGGLWGGKSRANLADGRSCCRNATLMLFCHFLIFQVQLVLQLKGAERGSFS